MCRNKDERLKRCKGDTSEARRLRRKTKNALDSHSPILSVEAAVPSVESSIESLSEIHQFPSLETFEDMKAEAATVSELLNAPRNPDQEAQREIDAVLEMRVTHLGTALAHEAEIRARFDKAAFERSYNRPSFGTFVNNFFGADGEETARQIKMRTEAMERLTEAYKSVIADIRPVGGKLSFDSYTEVEAFTVMKSTVESHYPTDWINQSNDHGPLAAIVEPNGGRASYQDEKIYSERQDGIKVPIKSYYVFNEEDAQEYCDFLSEDGDLVELESEAYMQDGASLYKVRFPKRFPFNPAIHPNHNNRPYGDDWKFGYVPDEDGNLPDNKGWYRTEHLDGTSISTLSLHSREEQPNGSTAYHEFVHRAEASVTNEKLTRMEESFLRRRTTDENGNREPLIALYPGETFDETEWVRRDNFMIPYVGREYIHGRDREVLSVGSEALFAGGFGAFLGLDNDHKEDKDHRAFTLGLFATG